MDLNPDYYNEYVWIHKTMDGLEVLSSGYGAYFCGDGCITSVKRGSLLIEIRRGKEAVKISTFIGLNIDV